MSRNEQGGGFRVEFYERTELPPPAQEQADDVYRQLDALAEGGELSAVHRESWVKRIPVEKCASDLRDTYLSFNSWATENGLRLTPFFQTRECFRAEVGDYTNWLVFPAFCLAIYEGETLTAVYPHADEDRTRTVQDGVDSLREGETGTAPEAALAD